MVFFILFAMLWSCITAIRKMILSKIKAVLHFCYCKIIAIFAFP